MAANVSRIFTLVAAVQFRDRRLEAFFLDPSAVRFVAIFLFF